MKELVLPVLSPKARERARKDPRSRKDLVHAALLEANGQTTEALVLEGEVAVRAWSLVGEALQNDLLKLLAQWEAASPKKKKSKGERKRAGAARRALRQKERNRGR